ncbi:hypothetical protein BpHYR1_015162 [Brachionus plicatilis]|uniref:Uncharacterized protein n=1 Tax=Brachionus plicatilis TaxID=10195 RepID=A0A3M7Q4S0_BRAPC|nr:hypothetical protein BpHYR1_015162 [Brachionus plicatilis]
MHSASNVLGDRIWYLKPAHKRGVSKKLSGLWIGPYTILSKQGEHNYLIRPDVNGKKRLGHVNNLKRCFSPAENVSFCASPNEAFVKQKENFTIVATIAKPGAEEEVRNEDSYWLDDQYLNLNWDDSEDKLSESDLEPNYYLKAQKKMEFACFQLLIEIRVDYLKDNHEEK